MHSIEKMGWSVNNEEALSGIESKLKLNQSVLVFTL